MNEKLHRLVLVAALAGCGSSTKGAAMSSSRDVQVTRVFDAPVERVWAAWRDGEEVKRWFSPTGFTTPTARMDFRVGGTSLVSMKAPPEYGGGETFMTWSYRAIEPHQRIEFVLRFADAGGAPVEPASLGMPPGIPPSVRHVITFAPAAGGGTAMTITEYGYTTDAAHDMSKAGLLQALDKLDASLRPPSAPGS
jgi:uncharacterized protein YndB with AHSA1/START domain